MVDINVGESLGLTLSRSATPGSSYWRMMRRLVGAAGGRGTAPLPGTTKSVTLDVEYSEPTKDPWGGERVGIEARTTINRKDFNLNWNVALEAGGILVSEKIQIELDVQATRA